MAFTTRQDEKTAPAAEAPSAAPADASVSDPLLAYNENPDSKAAAAEIMKSFGGGSKEKPKDKEQPKDDRSFGQRITDGLNAQLESKE